MAKNKNSKSAAPASTARGQRAPKGVLRRVLRLLFEFYPVLLPVTLICILINAIVSAVPSIFMQNIIAIGERIFWQLRYADDAVVHFDAVSGKDGRLHIAHHLLRVAGERGEYVDFAEHAVFIKPGACRIHARQAPQQRPESIRLSSQVFHIPLRHVQPPLSPK